MEREKSCCSPRYPHFVASWNCILWRTLLDKYVLFLCCIIFISLTLPAKKEATCCRKCKIKVTASVLERDRTHKCIKHKRFVVGQDLKKNRKQRWLLAFKKADQNTQEVKNERFLISTRQKQSENFRHTLPLTKRQTDIKHEKEKQT